MPLWNRAVSRLSRLYNPISVRIPWLWSDSDLTSSSPSDPEVRKIRRALRRRGQDLDELPVSRPGAQSSNTVVTLGESLFLKGYRRLRPGVNPELEVGRFLTEVARYPHCVPVAGALEYTAHDGTQMTLALVQSYVANQGDGWDYTLGYLERFLEEAATP